MAARYPSKDLRTVEEALVSFLAAAELLLEDRGNDEQRKRVANAAGQAHRAAEMANFYVAHTDPPAAGGRTVAYDPIMNWNMAISPFGDPLSEAIEAAHQISGILASAAEQAEREERSIVGRVARFVGFPSRVRRHLADGGYSTGIQRAGVAVSIVSQLAIATAATYLASALVTWISN